MGAMAMAKRKNRGGRPRAQGVERQPDGRVRPQRELAVPLAAVARRAEANGLRPESVSEAGARLLCQDQSAGTALGAVMWVRYPSGERQRRMMGDTPLITDAMAQAADIYRATWATWHATSGLPPRSAKARDYEGKPRETGDRALDETAAERAADKITRATDALRQCNGCVLVQRAVDMVVIDNTLPPQFLDRPQAVDALRRGLQALADVFVHGR